MYRGTRVAQRVSVLHPEVYELLVLGHVLVGVGVRDRVRDRDRVRVRPPANLCGAVSPTLPLPLPLPLPLNLCGSQVGGREDLGLLIGVRVRVRVGVRG